MKFSINRNHQNHKKIFSFLLVLLILCTLLTGCQPVSMDDVGPHGSMTITMLNVEQGLSILIQVDDEAMIYDGGGRKSSSYVVSYMQQHGIDHFKYLVASHYDEDHIAGLIGLFKQTKVDTVVRPDYQKDNKEAKTYQSFLAMEQDSSANTMYAKAGDSLTLGEATITVLSSAPADFEDENDKSIVLRIDYGNFSCIMTGDATANVETAMLEEGQLTKTVLYVAGHHGSDTSSSKEFLDQIRPEATFISCKLGNDYFHPAKNTLNRLLEARSKIFRTDLQGEVSVTTNGRSWEFSQPACEDFRSGKELLDTLSDRFISFDPEETESQATTSQAWEETPNANQDPEQTNPTQTNPALPESSEIENPPADPDRNQGADGEELNLNNCTYVLNVNSKRIHKPDCPSVDKMQNTNKAYVNLTLEELASHKDYHNFICCGNCLQKEKESLAALNN